MAGLYSPGYAVVDDDRVASLIERVKHSQAPVIFHCNALGDHLLIRPTILALQKIFKGQLGFIGALGMAHTFYPDASFRTSQVVPFLPGEEESHLFNVNDVMSYLDEFDCIINLNWWDSPQMYALMHALELSHIPFISLVKHHGHFPPIDTTQHISDYAFQLVKGLDASLDIDDFSSLPPIDPQADQRAKQIRNMMPENKKILAVHTLTREDKRWSMHKFKMLIDQFLEANNDYIAMVVDRTDAELDGGDYESRIFCLDQVDLMTTTALVARSDAFLGIDSYFLHVADFARIPSVGLFGPTSPAHWGFRFTRHHHVAGAATSDIGVSEVFEAMRHVFNVPVEIDV